MKPVGGSVSVTVPLVARAFDALLTKMVYLPVWPGLTAPKPETAAERFGVVGVLLVLPLLAQPARSSVATIAATPRGYTCHYGEAARLGAHSGPPKTFRVVAGRPGE